MFLPVNYWKHKKSRLFTFNQEAMSNKNHKINQVVTGASLQELEIDLSNDTLLESQEVKMEISDNNRHNKSWKGTERRSGEDRRRFAYRTGGQDKRSGRDRRRKRAK